VVPFARSAMHVGTVRHRGQKMAKSTGNLVLVTDLLREHPASAIRMLLLDRVWHEPWEYRPADLDAAAGRLEDLYSAAARPDRSATAGAAITSALLDNLDVPRAVAIARQEGGDAARGLLHTLSLS